MSLFDFAYKNITRDFKTYLYHFISCACSVFVFFIFSMLSNHPVLRIVDSNSAIGLILKLSGIVTILFSFVLILFSIGNFLRQRSKQFAILNIIGTSKRQFKSLVFLENFLISLFALASGIVMGIVFSKLFLMIAERMIGDINLNFYFPLKALLITVLFMGGLFLISSLIAPVILRRKNVIDLLKKEEISEKNPFIFSLAAVIFTVPITVYLYINMPYSYIIYVFYLLSFVSLSYFLFVSIFEIYGFIMKKSGKIYRGTNLVKISNFRYRISSNIKTMTGAMILFSIVLTAFVYIVGSPENVVEDTEKIMPYSYMYSAWNNDINDVHKAEILKRDLSRKEGYRDITIRYSVLNDTGRDILLSNTMYNNVEKFLGRNTVNLKNNEYFLVASNTKTLPKLNKSTKSVLENNGIYKLLGIEKRVIALSGYFSNITVVSDSMYNKISGSLGKKTIYAFAQKDFRENKGDFEKLKKDIEFEMGKEHFSSAYNYYRTEKLTRSLTSYAGSILSISFLIGIASIIYSRLYSMIEEESRKYAIMQKLGLGTVNLKNILSNTVKWIFVLPFLVSFAVSWAIVIRVNQSTITSYLSLAGACSIIYIVIELIMYFVIKNRYENKILKNIESR